MSDEPEIGKEMLKEEKLTGISDTSQNKDQIEQIAKDSSGIALGMEYYSSYISDCTNRQNYKKCRWFFR